MKIAILGDGQIGALSSQSAQKMKHEVGIFGAVGEKSPAGQISNYYGKINYGNPNESIRKILEYQPDVITSEWENIPVDILKGLEKRGMSVYPNSQIMESIQNRKTEKKLITSTGCKVVDYESDINSVQDLKNSFERLGSGILKTAREGYDGKGQYRINNFNDISNLELDFKNIEYIYEQLEKFDYEISVIIARNPNGESIIYEPAYNKHENGILKTSVIPANLSEIEIMNETILKAKNIAKTIADDIGMVGVLCIEMFVLSNGEIKVNEIAPRPHNSGHHTIESYNISQYDALIKALSNKTLQELKLVRKSVLTNLLGDDIYKSPRKEDKKFNIEQEGSFVYYDYGKEINRKENGNLPSGRKMGHKVELF